MIPVLGMRYEHPGQLKLALASYGVSNGYQLWFERNDWKSLLMYCGRNVEDGRSVGRYTNKKRKVQKSLFNDDDDSTSKSPKKTKKSTKASKKTKKYKNLPKKKVSFSQPIMTRGRKRGRDVALMGRELVHQ